MGRSLRRLDGVDHAPRRITYTKKEVALLSDAPPLQYIVFGNSKAYVYRRVKHRRESEGGVLALLGKPRCVDWRMLIRSAKK